MDEQHDCESSGAETLDAHCRELTAEFIRLATQAGLPPARAADVAQDVWLKFFERHPDFVEDNAHEQERAWLLKVAHHEIANAFRAYGRHPTRSLEALPEEPIDPHGQESANQEEAAHVLLLRWLDERHLKSPLNHRLVYGHHIEGIDAETLAAETGLTANKVYCRIHAEIQKFRAWFSQLPDEDLPWC